MLKTIKVVAAVIRDGGQVFATQRGYGDYKDWWEFPGGKIEPGESPQQALVREIREELAAEVEVGPFIITVEYDYPKFHLSMDCFWCTVKEGHLQLLEHEAAKWLPLGDLRQVAWLPADVLVVEEIERQTEAETQARRPEMLTLQRAKELNATMVTEDHLIVHALNVSYAMGAMARHFGEDPEHWEAIGMLHDYDYQQYPEEHLKHTEKPLLEAGVDPADVRAILSHGWGICTDVEPQTDLEKSLFTVDELTGIIQACARMRPAGIKDLEVKSFMKKFKDKRFAAKCDRELILKGCEMLGMDVKDVAAICIEGMRPHAEELGIAGTAEA